jgi:hypothetical protein
MKEPVRGEIAPKKISHIQFGLLSANEMERLSEFQVYRSDLFTMPQVPICVCLCIYLWDAAGLWSVFWFEGWLYA